MTTTNIFETGATSTNTIADVHQANTTSTDSYQSARNNSLAAIEANIADMTARMNNSKVEQASTQPQSTSNITQESTNLQTAPSDGTATPNLGTPTTPEELSYQQRFVKAKQYYDQQITDTRAQVASLEAKLANAPAATADEAIATNDTAHRETMNARVLELESQLATSRQEKAVGDVVKKHSDFYDIVSSQDWDTWKDTQPANIQAMITGNTDDSVSMIRALDLYKFDKNIAGSSQQSQTTTKATQTIQPSAADSVSTGQSTTVNVDGSSNGRIWTRSEISRMSGEEYKVFQEDILLAQTQGRIRDDKTNR